MSIVLQSLNLAQAERELCEAALETGGSIVEAATLLGITRHALKRRIIKHDIQWPPARHGESATTGGPELMSAAGAVATG
jgi:DNA-binding NtrC family response regulator